MASTLSPRARDTGGSFAMLINTAGSGMVPVSPKFMPGPQPVMEATPTGFRDVVETEPVGRSLMKREVVQLMLNQVPLGSSTAR